MSFLFRLVPVTLFERLLALTVELRTESLDAQDGLRLVLALDNRLYHQTGALAVTYGDGEHVKHRLTGYVDYFADLAADLGGPYLDIGCGNGELAKAVAQRTEHEVVGVDIEPSRIIAARKQDCPRNLSFVEGDAVILNLEASFRTLVLSNVYEHIAGRSSFLRGLVDRYAPEHLLIRVPLFERDWRVPLKRELGIEWRLDSTHAIEHTRDELSAELLEAGLQVLRQEICWGEIWAVAKPETEQVFS